jgi:predicted ATP-dependent endonuclease of OLD family
MIFSELTISGFRSIDEKGIKISFDPARNLYSLVGPNNAGKSNILDALALVLGVRNGKFYNYRITEQDFYNRNTKVPICIRLRLSAPVHYRNVFQQQGSIDGFVLHAKEYVKGDSKGDFHIDHYCFGRNAKGVEQDPLIEPQRIYKKKSDSDQDVDNSALPLLARDHTYKLGTTYFLDIQNMQSFLNVAGSGPLGRVFRVYREDFRTTNSTYSFVDAAGDTKTIPSKDAFEKASIRLSEILRTEKLKEIEKSLSDNISEYLGLEKNQRSSITLGIPDYEELFEKMATLKVEESKELKPIQIDSLGAGYLSLFRMAALRTLAGLEDKEVGIYLVEEPEIYLHPHLRRFFFRTLQSLADKGNQIVFSTHSEEFVSIRNYHSVIRVEKGNGLCTEVHQVPLPTSINFDNLHLKIQAKGNEDIFFAKHVLLTEGQDDRAVFEELLTKEGVDCSAKSISVADCGGKKQIPDYIRLCEALGINYFAIFDTDKGNASSASDSNKIISACRNDKTKYYALPDALEAALDTVKAGSENWRHLLGIIDPLDASEIRTRFPEVHPAVEAFKKTL